MFLDADDKLFFNGLVDRLVTQLQVGSLASAVQTFTDGAVSFRYTIRNGIFVLDKTLTPLGFSGVENTDWVNINETI